MASALSRPLRQILSGMIQPFLARGGVSAVAIGRSVARRLRAEEATGSREAAAIVDLAVDEYAIHFAGRAIREQAIVRVSWAGKALVVPARLSVPVRNGAGSPTGARQYPLWMELPERELVALRQRLNRQADKLSGDVAAMDRVLQLIRDTGAANGIEACAVRGLDPQDLVI